MTGYQVPQDDTSMDFQYWLDYVADQQRYPLHHDDADHTDYSPLQTVLRPCRNLACANSSYAVFCSEACRSEREGDDTDDYYADSDSDTLLGLKALADQQWQADQHAGGFAAMVCGVKPQAAPVAVAPTFSEAPISITLKGLRQGVDTMITIRGTDLESVQVQLSVAAAWFDAPAASAPSTPVETGEGFCQTHQVQMKLNPAKPGQGKDWYSHKHQGQWCRGKAA